MNETFVEYPQNDINDEDSHNQENPEALK
jgi:hypothetical protein